MDNLPLFVFGLALLVLPILLLFWRTSTRSGRKAYERKLRKSEKEVQPAKPSRKALSIFVAAYSVLLGLSLITENAAIDLVATAFSFFAIGYFLWFYLRTGQNPLA